jgi:hypothetical protein
MSKVKFPYKGWVLMPSFAPKELNFVESDWMTGDWHVADNSAKYYTVAEIYKTKNEAIVAGREKLAKLRLDLAKRSATIEKRQAALDKAE